MYLSFPMTISDVASKNGTIQQDYYQINEGSGERLYSIIFKYNYHVNVLSVFNKTYPLLLTL